MINGKVFVSRPLHKDALELLKDTFSIVDVWEEGTPSQDEFKERARNCMALVTVGIDKVDSGLFDMAPGVKVSVPVLLASVVNMILPDQGSLDDGMLLLEQAWRHPLFLATSSIHSESGLNSISSANGGDCCCSTASPFRPLTLTTLREQPLRSDRSIATINFLVVGSNTRPRRNVWSASSITSHRVA